MQLGIHSLGGSVPRATRCQIFLHLKRRVTYEPCRVRG